MPSRSSRPPLRMLLPAMALVLTLSGVLTARSAPPPFVTANNFVLQQGQTLPVFQVTAPSVTGESTSDLSQRFSAIYDRQGVASESYLGKPALHRPQHGYDVVVNPLRCQRRLLRLQCE